MRTWTQGTDGVWASDDGVRIEGGPGHFFASDGDSALIEGETEAVAMAVADENWDYRGRVVTDDEMRAFAQTLLNETPPRIYDLCKQRGYSLDKIARLLHELDADSVWVVDERRTPESGLKGATTKHIFPVEEDAIK